ncbi:MAG: ABC transporter ATP-binding protein [Candidatus Sumerlaeia bacterium]
MPSTPGGMSSRSARRLEKLKNMDARPEEGLKNLWRFLTYSRAYWPWIIGGFVAGLIRMILPMYMPNFVRHVIDDVLMPEDMGMQNRIDTFYGMLPLLITIMSVHLFATLGRFYFPHVAAASAVRDIRFCLYRHIQRLSLGFHDTRPSGSVVSRLVTDVQTAQHAFEIIFVVAAQMFMQAIGIGVYLLFRDWVWALVAFCTIPFYVVTTRLLRKPIRQASRKMLESAAEMSGHMHERLSMIREVQAFTTEKHEEREVYDRASMVRQHTLRQRLLHGCLVAASELTRFGGLTIVAAFGVYRVINGNATVGDLTAFYLYTGLIMGPISQLANMYGQVYSAAAAADRVFEFLDTKPQIKDEPDSKPLILQGAPEIRLEGVQFSYPTEERTMVLRDINCKIEPGMRVVLAGPSGAGKSTLLGLLPRFYDIQQGKILLNGQDIRDLQYLSLRKAIAIVPQEPVLFTGTILENIKYSKLNASFDEVKEAVRSANAEEFIENLPDGYKSVIGERGVGISGGQIQRIAIARAFLKDPKILIMDEATSNLDATSERLVLEALDRLAAGRTTLIIAHRLSVARKADMILVLDRGEIVESGNHEELVEKDGLYAKLWHEQVGPVG